MKTLVELRWTDTSQTKDFLFYCVISSDSTKVDLISSEGRGMSFLPDGCLTAEGCKIMHVISNLAVPKLQWY